MKQLRAALLLVAFAALVAPASALAAPPANDDFADRQPLSGPLPIEANGSNVEATKEGEVGEGISVFAAGHSVWFEWEAPSTGWVTIGACGSDFPAVVGIFTGSSLGSLSKVAEGNAKEGPHCLYAEREYTFKAIAGTEYAIGVDGNAYTGPQEAPVDTEGEIELRIEATPPPANDDFADAADLTAAADIYEIEPGERFYFARLEGYNWTATKEVGEPAHQGDPGGASVWYEWTAPATGTARMSACCFGGPLLGIYTGNALGALVPVPTESEFPPEVRAEVTAGQTYRIAVDGQFDELTGEATKVWFSVNAWMNLPPLPPPPDPPAIGPQPDLLAPETSVSKRVLKRKPPIFIFRFGASEPGSTFLCALDRRPFKPCGSSRTFRKPIPGRHKLRVVAVDAAGNADPTPAVARFRFPPR